MNMKKKENEKVEQARFQANPEELVKASGFVLDTMRAAGCNEKICKQMDIVVEEIFINIASYAYPDGKADKPVIIECGREENRVYLAFRDRGMQYNPLEKEDPAIGIVGKMTIGGYGIFMVKNIVDEIEYQYAYEAGENVLRMWKRM